MEGRSVMLQASTLQSAPQGTRLGIRQYGCSLDGQNQGLLAQCSCPEAPETWETPTTSASAPPNLSGTTEVPVQGRGGGKQPLFCAGCRVCVESWL